MSAAGPTALLPNAADRRELVRLCTAGSLAYCSYQMCRTPLLPLFARELGADAPMVGFVVAASTLTGILVKLPAGAWSDVVGRRLPLVTAGVVFAVMPFAYLGVASLGALVALRFIHGSATAVFGPVASAGLSDIAPPRRRATWLSMYSTMQGAGQALGPVIAGYLLAQGRYDTVFLTAGAIAFAAPIITSRWPSTRHREPASRGRARFIEGIAEVGREPLILMTSLAQATQFVLHGALNAFLPLFAREELGLGLAQLGWLFGVQTVTTLATRPIVGAIADRVGRRSVICTGLTVCSVAVLLVSLSTGGMSLTAATVVYAVGVAITTAATSAYITDLARRARYGAAHGVFGTIYDVGDALGPIGAGLLVAAVGYAPMFRVMAAIALASTVTFYVASRSRRDT